MFFNQLRVQLNKSKTKDQTIKGAQIWGWQLNLTEVKLHETRSS